MKCMNCGAEMGITVGLHLYEVADGLHVILKGVKKTSCPACGETGVVIPKIGQLNETIAKSIARKPERLAPGEVRFLRKYLGWSGKGFAHRFGVTPETISRWENGVRQMSSTAERLLRLSAIELSPVDEYPVPDLVEGGQAKQMELELDKEWSVVA